MLENIVIKNAKIENIGESLHKGIKTKLKQNNKNGLIYSTKYSKKYL